MGILLSFLPWIAFWILSGRDNFKVAAVTSVASAIDSTVTQVESDKNKQSNDQKNEQNQINQNQQSMESSHAFQSLGLVGTAQESATAKIAGSSSF